MRQQRAVRLRIGRQSLQYVRKPAAARLALRLQRARPAAAALPPHAQEAVLVGQRQARQVVAAARDVVAAEAGREGDVSQESRQAGAGVVERLPAARLVAGQPGARPTAPRAGGRGGAAHKAAPLGEGGVRKCLAALRKRPHGAGLMVPKRERQSWERVRAQGHGAAAQRSQLQ